MATDQRRARLCFELRATSLGIPIRGRSISAEINYRQWRSNLNRCIAADSDVRWIEHPFAYATVTLVAHNGFDEADLQTASKVDDAEAIGGLTPARIAKARRAFAKPQRIPETSQVNSSEPCSSADYAQARV